MKIIFIGDIFGDAGRDAIRQALPSLKSKFKIDFAVGNCENVAGGFGVTPKLADELLGHFQVLTSGNHLFDQKEIIDYLPTQTRLLRPLNYLSQAPGCGSWVGKTQSGVRVAVINLIGQVYMAPVNSPFEAVDRELERLLGQVDAIFVDMHAEASGEKMAMAHYLDGRVTAVLGTHTHVQTADECILRGGTAYITDVGMTGPYDSIIGMNKQMVLPKYKVGYTYKPRAATEDLRLCAVVVEVEDQTGRALQIERIQEKILL